MEHTADIAIVGGGLNGAALALALTGQGWHVALIDAGDPVTQTADTFDGRGYALALGSQRVLSALGVWGELDDHAQPILEITVSDGRAGQGPSPMVLHFDHAEIEEGPMGFMVEDRFVRRALMAALAQAPGLTHLTGTRVTGQDTAGARARLDLADGGTVSAKLIVGCDGRMSPVAARAGIAHVRWQYDQTALVCAIDHALPHGGNAHQFFMPAGPIAILPLPGNRSSIVWTESTARAAEISAMDDAGYLAELRPRFGDFRGEISLAGKRFSYPLGLSLAHHFVAPRVALVGDAAHAVHPIAGQGLNAGLRDVAALAEVLTDAARRGEDYARIDVLERYQQWRRFDATALALATDGFNRLFSNDNGLLRLGRDLGLGLVNALPGLRRGFIREAAGLTGQMPRMMQGRPL